MRRPQTPALIIKAVEDAGYGAAVKQEHGAAKGNAEKETGVKKVIRCLR